MRQPQYKVGMILENAIRQFTKIISVKSGIYFLSGWSDRKSAEKATHAHLRVNKYGLQFANVRIASTANVEEDAPDSTEDDLEDDSDLDSDDGDDAQLGDPDQDSLDEELDGTTTPDGTEAEPDTNDQDANTPQYTRSSLREQSTDNLRAMCARMSLSVDGDKEDLLKRLYPQLGL